MSGYEIDPDHFLPNQKVISQMNRTAMINSIRTTNSHSLSRFQNLKVCRTMFDFCGHALLIKPNIMKNVQCIQEFQNALK